MTGLGRTAQIAPPVVKIHTCAIYFAGGLEENPRKTREEKDRKQQRQDGFQYVVPQ